MKRIAALLVCCSMFAVSKASFADTIVAFNLTSTYTSDGTSVSGNANGTVLVDVTTGTFGAANVTGNDGAVSLTFLGTARQTRTQVGSGAIYYIDYNDTTGTYGLQLDLYAPSGSLAGYSGGSLCSNTNSACTYNNFAYRGYLIGAAGAPGTLAGSLTAATPEPSALALLSTGMLGLATLGRKRLFGMRFL